ncbi:FAD-dependent oxidoreductase [Streptomyces griseocarneus]|nr:FAD-dependent oxidoreductase [Streptomyces griseocarneus]GHG50371.1 hypothetical protein GCM10018779_10430 [Streptomyces griseocarneus]
MIIGAGDSAAEAAKEFRAAGCASVTLIGWNREMNATLVTDINTLRISAIWPAEVVKLIGEEKVEGVAYRTRSESSMPSSDPETIIAANLVHVLINGLPNTK